VKLAIKSVKWTGGGGGWDKKSEGGMGKASRKGDT
jgi:hypothetical protein